MVVENDYRPSQKAQLFHGSECRVIVLVGGLGCVRGSTRIETSVGLVPIEDLQEGSLVWSAGDEGFSLKRCSKPYVKGRARLFRVVHSGGEFVAHARHLICDSEGKYLPLDECVSGMRVLSYPLVTTLAEDLKESALDERSWIQTASGSLADYLGLGRLCDQLLRYVLRLCPERSPLPGDELKSSQSFLSEGDQSIPRDTHLFEESSPHSNQGCLSQASAPVLSEGGSPLTELSEHTSSDIRPGYRFQQKSECRQIKVESWSSHTLTRTYSTIISISQLDEAEDYWDLEVEDNHNYLAEGMIHHNSGKSFSVVKELEQSAIQWPNIPMAVYRKTMPALRDSTLHEFKSHADPALGDYKAREDSWEYVNGSFVKFRGLDDPTKAKSTNYALIVMEEAEEFTFEDFQRLNERVRAPGPWPHRIILVLNPVDEDHWIYQEFVTNKEVYERAGGLLVLHFSSYDNLDNLPPGYIEQASAGKTNDEIDRYIHGNWGTIVKGSPVYASILNPAIHLRTMERYAGQILLRGWDFGFNHPAVSFRLVDPYGRMNIADVLMGTKVDLPDFVPQVLAHTMSKFPNTTTHDFGDPRGHDKAPNGKETCFEVLSGFGISAKGERGSRDYVEEGIRQMKKEFSTLIQGVPMLTMDPNCTLIRTAYFARYVRGEDGRPIKDGYYDHVCDADRYISHHHRHNDAVQAAMLKKRLMRQSRGDTPSGYRRIR